jgi:hypothetical protein
MASKDVKIVITAQDRTKRAFASVSRGLAGVSRAAFSAKTALAGVGSGFAIKGIVNAASEVEQLKIRMKFLTGSTEDGAKAFQIMDKYASRVPFTLQDIQKATPALLAVAGDVKDLNGLLAVTGDISVASGISFQDTALQLQRALSSGIASAEIFRERAVRSMLGFQAGVEYTAEQTRQHIRDAFNGSTLDIKGATEAMAKTYAGNVSMMEDAWFKFKLALAETGVFEAVGKGIIWATEKFKLFAAMVKDPRLHDVLNGMAKVFTMIWNAVAQLPIVIAGAFGEVVKGIAWLDKAATEFLQSINNNLAKVNPTIQGLIPLTEEWLDKAKEMSDFFTIGLNDGLNEALGKTEELKNATNAMSFDIGGGKDTGVQLEPFKMEFDTTGTQGFNAQLNKMMLQVGDLDTAAVSMIGNFTDGLSTQLTEALMTGKASFGDFARSILAMITQMIIKMLIFKAISGLMTAFGGAAGGAGGAGGAVTSGLGAAPVGIEQNLMTGAVGTFASGGSVTGGSPVMVGEQGRELFIPKSNGSIVPSHKLNEFASGNTQQQAPNEVVNITLNLSTGVQQTVRAEVMGMMPVITKQVKGAVAEARQRGGSFSSQMGVV